MAASELLEALHAAGVEVRVDGDELVCRARPGVLTGGLLDRLRRHKPELLGLLGVLPCPAPLTAALELVAGLRRMGWSGADCVEAAVRRHHAEGILDLRDVRATCERIAATRRSRRGTEAR